MSRVHLALTIVTLFASSAFGADAGPAQLPTLASMAKPRELPAGAPAYGDVCFSSRWRHPRDPADKHDTFADAAAFHATRLDWVASTDRQWIAQCKEHGYHFGGWLSTILTDSPDTNTRLQGRETNAAGQPLAAPWMKSFNGIWGCANSPAYRRTFIDHAERMLDGGADVFQMDDPGMNVTAIRWGACYCDACRAKAKAQGVDLAKDMKAFQEQSLREFYADTRAEIDAYAGRHVPMSCNNYKGDWAFPYDLFDYGMAELPKEEARPATICAKEHEAMTRGKAQVFTFVSEDVTLMRRLIATTYACGGNPIVPYDVYLRSTPGGSARYFGKPEEYADLFGFVRGIAPYLEGYEDAAVAGPGFVDSRWGERPALAWQDPARPIWAFARAKPRAAGSAADEKKQEALVIHLVDWAGQDKPATLRLRREAFFPGQKWSVRLLTPVPYDARAHALAEKTKDFLPLARMTELQATADGEWASVSIPKLNPWGVVVVERRRDR